MAYDERGLRQRYPLFYAYGDSPRRLTIGEAAEATKEERIRSVWFLMVGMVLSFRRTLKPREAANFDPEDVLAELYIRVSEKDCRWNPERGAYTTFVGAVARNAMIEIRDKALPVEGPRNARCRLKEYAADETNGTLSDKKRSTYGKILRAIGEFEPIADGAGRASDDPADHALACEHKAIIEDALAQGIAQLKPIEAAILGYLYGLWGKPERSIPEIARMTGRCEDGIRLIRRKAHARLRKHLLELEHPAVTETV